MTNRVAALSTLGLVCTVATASVAEYTLVGTPSFVVLGETIRVEVFGQATEDQIGNNSGIGGVNLSVEISGGTIDLGSVQSNAETFGATNVFADAEGFDISFSANQFVGDNFSAGLVLFSFDIVVDQVAPLLVTTSQGQVSQFNAATGIPGAFQPSVAYDEVIFGSFESHLIPTPAGAVAFAMAGTLAARRKR